MQGSTQNKSSHIIYLGETDFPFGLGSVQRMVLVAKSVISVGVKVTVVVRKGVRPKMSHSQIGHKGEFEEINYVYTSPTTFRPNGFFRRNWTKLKGIYGEYTFLRRQKKDNNITAAIISCMSTLHVLRYKLYSLILGFPIVLNFVELGSTMKGRERPITRLNDYLFDNFIIKIVDGALPISEFLVDYYKRYSPNNPSLKLPILCDFEKFELRNKNDYNVTFLYCGAASYFELIDFLLKAFDELNDLPDKVVFQLILGGKEIEINRVKRQIKNVKNRNNIQLITNVNHKDIPEYYANSKSLLIPLRPTVQDKARFPHKIGEYLASGKPMITTRYGEIKNYDFIDGKTALVADEYDVEAYAQKMRFILENPVKSVNIGINGRQMGLNNFDYKKHGQPLKDYFSLFEKDKK